jgi:integrase
VETGRRSVLDVEQWAELRREHFVRGVSIMELMRRTGLARNTIRSALRSEAPPGFRCPVGPSKLPKAVQQLLGHASIQTTGDTYTDWDIDQLAATMAEVLDDDRPTDNEPNPKLIPLNPRKPLQNRTEYRQRDSNPCYRRERAAS